MLEGFPFEEKSLEISISLSLGFISNEIRDEESSTASFDSPISFSSSGFQNEVIRMEALTHDMLK